MTVKFALRLFSESTLLNRTLIVTLIFWIVWGLLLIITYQPSLRAILLFLGILLLALIHDLGLILSTIGMLVVSNVGRILIIEMSLILPIVLLLVVVVSIRIPSPLLFLLSRIKNLHWHILRGHMSCLGLIVADHVPNFASHLRKVRRFVLHLLSFFRLLHFSIPRLLAVEFLASKLGLGGIWARRIVPTSHLISFWKTPGKPITPQIHIFMSLRSISTPRSCLRPSSPKLVFLAWNLRTFLFLLAISGWIHLVGLLYLLVISNIHNVISFVSLSLLFLRTHILIILVVLEILGILLVLCTHQPSYGPFFPLISKHLSALSPRIVNILF